MKIIEIPIEAKWRWLQCECGSTDIGHRLIDGGGHLYWCKKCQKQFKSEINYPCMYRVNQFGEGVEVEE